jgi:hypothetical protein
MSRPIERPGTLTVPSRNSGTGAVYRQISTPKGTASPQSLYLTADRLYQVSKELNERDQEVLDFTNESRYVTGAQLIRGFWLTNDPDTNAARAGRRALKRLSDWRVLERLPRRIGGRRTGSDGFVYRVGRAGVRLLAARGIYAPRVEAPGTLHLVHTLQTTELALQLREAAAVGVLDVIEVQQEPRCWRKFVGVGGALRTLKPDLFARIGAGDLEDRWLIEIDLSSESGRTIARKAERYLEHYRSGREQHHHGTYPRVLWLTPDEHRADQIREVLRRQSNEAKRQFVTRTFDEALDFLTAEASS